MRSAAVPVLVAAVWLGLVVGFIDLALFLVRIRLIRHGYYLKSPHVVWMIPTANVALFGLIGVLLAALSRRLTRLGEPLAWWILWVLALLTPCLGIPGLRLGSSAVLAAGLASWLAPVLRARGERFGRLVWASFPPLALALLLFAGASVLRDWSPQSGVRPRGPAPRDAPNVLLVVMDTVRADATDLAATTGVRTPNLARLAGRGARFERAIATAPWTLPSHASMFTGRWPSELRVGRDRALDDRFPTLAEFFTQHGYATAGFAANTHFCTREYGLSRGFQHYEDFVVSPLEILRSASLGWLIYRQVGGALDRLSVAAGREAEHPFELPAYRKHAAEINQAAVSWIERRGDRPFFVFLNYLDAHGPYLTPAGAGHPLSQRSYTLAERRMLREWAETTPPKTVPESIRLAREAYEDCVAVLDREIGRLIDALERLGQLDRTLIVITSDHGEHFGEHTCDGVPLVGHCQSVYQAETHVPLLVVAPRRVPAGTVVGEPVSLRDLPATIVELAGIGTPSPFPGRAFLPRADGAAASSAALAEFSAEPSLPAGLRYGTGARGLMRAVVVGSKAYHVRNDGTEALYDLASDPEESRNLASACESRAALEKLRATLRAAVGPR